MSDEVRGPFDGLDEWGAVQMVMHPPPHEAWLYLFLVQTGPRVDGRVVPNSVMGDYTRCYNESRKLVHCWNGTANRPLAAEWAFLCHVWNRGLPLLPWDDYLDRRRTGS